MATITAIKTGNWSDTTVWNGGVLPGINDTANTASYTVTVDGTYTVTSLIQTTGVFVFGENSQLTVTGTLRSTNFTEKASILRFSLDSPKQATLIANILCPLPGVHTYYLGTVDMNGTGTLNIVGNLDARVGFLVGGASYSSKPACVMATAEGIVNVTGNVYGQDNSGGSPNTESSGINGLVLATFNITGNIYAGSIKSAIYGACNINVVGDTYASSSKAAIDTLFSTTVNLNSKVSTVGSIFATSAENAIKAPAVIPYGRLVGNLGRSAIYSPKLFLSNNSIVRWETTTYDTLSANYLYTANQLPGQPNITDVRYNVTFGPSNELTGTCHVPSAASVFYGVPTGNTIGTATISAENIREALGLSSANLDIQLSNIPSTQEIWEYSTRELTQEINVDFSPLQNTLTTLTEQVTETNQRIVFQVPEGPVIVIPGPSASNTTLAWSYCYDENGKPAANTVIYLKLIGVDDSTKRGSYLSKEFTAISNIYGVAATEIPRGNIFKFKVKSGDNNSWIEFRGTNDEQLELPFLISK